MARPRRAVLLHLPGFEPSAPVRPVSPAARALSSRDKHRTAPAPKPWECVVLAVDTARQSGWALYVVGKYEQSGEIDTLDATGVELVVSIALERAMALGKPLVMALEFRYGGRQWVTAGLAVACERWRAAWRKAGISERRALKVGPSTWRAAVLGSPWAHARREGVRSVEQAVAAGLARRAVGPDEAAAVCIGHWASHAPEVGKAIGKRASKASLKSWLGGGA